LRRLRPNDSLGGHHTRLSAGRTARSRSGERGGRESGGGGLPSRAEVFAPDPKKQKQQAEGLVLTPQEAAQLQSDLVKDLADPAEPVLGIAA
jgi:hypothetical protein